MPLAHHQQRLTSSSLWVNSLFLVAPKRVGLTNSATTVSKVTLSCTAVTQLRHTVGRDFLFSVDIKPCYVLSVTCHNCSHRTVARGDPRHNHMQHGQADRVTLHYITLHYIRPALCPHNAFTMYVFAMTVRTTAIISLITVITLHDGHGLCSLQSRK